MEASVPTGYAWVAIGPGRDVWWPVRLGAEGGSRESIRHQVAACVLAGYDGAAAAALVTAVCSLVCSFVHWLELRFRCLVVLVLCSCLGFGSYPRLLLLLSVACSWSVV